MASPFQSTRRDPFSLSSSPGLPSLDQIQSQIPRRPPIRSGSAARPIPDHANRGFTSASGFFREEQLTAIDLTTPCKAPDTTANPPHEEEEVTVISLATLTSKPKKRKGGKVREKKADEPTSTTKPAKPKAEKKPKAKSKETVAAKKGETVSRHFAKPKGKGKDKEEAEPAPTKKGADDEPLALEAAMRRRTDWTPPPADTGLGSKVSHAVDLLSSADKTSTLDASKETFENLFENFGRAEDEPTRPSVEPLEVSNPTLRKRKRIEAVSINNVSKSAPAAGATKAKAPRKKPRTITELATAAYVTPDASEQHAPTAVPVESVEDNEEPTNAKKRKRPSRAKPKKIIPPEPVLLSPTAALRQAANQDYVFGTSSQLARDQSPTFLRNLQAALRASNSRPPEEDPFVTPINSDAAEPAPRQKLWGVGARDEDGRVLDLEVINLADTPQADTGASDGPNPFGYVATTNMPVAPPHLPSDDSFPDIDELLNREPAASAHEAQQTLPPAALARPPAAAAAHKQAREETPPLVEAPPLLEEADSFDDEDIDLPPVLPPSRATNPAARAIPQPRRPNFDLYTDNQLSREISSYGFKPVKRRQAMLALLDQCWSSKQRTALSSLPTNHPISTAAHLQTAAKSEGAAPVVPSKQSQPSQEMGDEAELSSIEVAPKRRRPKQPLDQLSLQTLRKALRNQDFEGRPESKTPLSELLLRAKMDEDEAELSSIKSPPKRPRARLPLDKLSRIRLLQVLREQDFEDRPESKTPFSELLARAKVDEDEAELSSSESPPKRPRARLPLDQLSPESLKRVLRLQDFERRPESKIPLSELVALKLGPKKKASERSQKTNSEGDETELSSKESSPKVKTPRQHKKRPLDQLAPGSLKNALRYKDFERRPASSSEFMAELSSKESSPDPRKKKKPLDQLSPIVLRRVLRQQDFEGRPEAAPEFMTELSSKESSPSRWKKKKPLDQLSPLVLKRVLRLQDFEGRPESTIPFGPLVREKTGPKRKALEDLNPEYRLYVMTHRKLDGRPPSKSPVSEYIAGKTGLRKKKSIEDLSPDYRRRVLRRGDLDNRPESKRDLSEFAPKPFNWKRPLDELSPGYRRLVLEREGPGGVGRPPSRGGSSSPPPSAQPPRSSPTRRGRPRKNGVIEIPDSESEGSYRSFDRAFSSPPPDEDEDMSPATSPKSQDELDSLFALITEAITSAPPAVDPKKPSFHEMILMYDPIVLEDLAAWLNTGQLSRVGYDDEVSAAEVKQWCESKSVLCLWRAGLKGQERKRF